MGAAPSYARYPRTSRDSRSCRRFTRPAERAPHAFRARLCAWAQAAERIYLAPDPDREGEAIAWHLAGALKNVRRPIQRLTFNEIRQAAMKIKIIS